MPLLPSNFTAIAATGGQWSATFAFQNGDGTPMNITGKVFEFVVRSRVDATGALFSFTSTVGNAFGYMVVNTASSTVQVVVTPTATRAITEGGALFALWMDQGLPDAVAMVTGTFYTQPVPQP